MTTLIIALALALFSLPGDARAEETVDLELVLAIDASGSVDDSEWALQMQGYATAFRDEKVQAAISSGPNSRIGVAVVVWADAAWPRWESEWFVLAAPSDAERFAAFMAGLGRSPIGGTGIGTGVATAIAKLDRNGLTARRQVVDVSGDGRETPPRDNVVLMPAANAMARARGVTVNGLAILNDDPRLAEYYRNDVIAGQDAFVMTAVDYEDFAEAITRKLLREIEHQERVSVR